MMHTTAKTALITGATSGIGRASARLFVKNGLRVIACGRRADRLKEIQEELGAQCHTLAFDVRNRQEVEAAVGSLPGAWQDIDILLNNAGNAHGLSSIQQGNVDDWEAMIDINVKGLLYVSREIIPRLIKKGSGHIVNIGSIAGKEVYANGNVYCASKFAVDALNNGMRIDLNQHGIKVSSVNPGLVETEFSMVRFKGDKEKAASVYKGYTPLSPEDIADLIYFIVSRPAHVNISDTIILPLAQASASMVNRKA